MSSFNIQIDDAQRTRIIAALQLLDAQQPVNPDESVTAFGVAHLCDMLVKLPQDEAEYPGITHGLCM